MSDKYPTNNVVQPRGGLNFPSALTLLFIGLKLTEEIDWSWIWVLSPFWILWVLLMLAAAGNRK